MFIKHDNAKACMNSRLLSRVHFLIHQKSNIQPRQTTAFGVIL
jgi:hypothetical protein